MKTKEQLFTIDKLILGLIPHGHENAIEGKQLANAAGITQREVRQYVSELRKDTVILNMQDGKGYFKPLPDEMYLVERWVAQEESRLKHIGSSLKAGRRAIRGAK